MVLMDQKPRWTDWLNVFPHGIGSGGNGTLSGASHQLLLLTYFVPAFRSDCPAHRPAGKHRPGGHGNRWVWSTRRFMNMPYAKARASRNGYIVLGTLLWAGLRCWYLRRGQSKARLRLEAASR